MRAWKRLHDALAPVTWRDVGTGLLIVVACLAFALIVAATALELLWDGERRRPRALAIPTPAPSATVETASNPGENPDPSRGSFTASTPRLAPSPSGMSDTWLSGDSSLDRTTGGKQAGSLDATVTPVRSAVDEVSEGLASVVSPVYRAPVMDESILGDRGIDLSD